MNVTFLLSFILIRCITVLLWYALPSNDPFHNLRLSNAFGNIHRHITVSPIDQCAHILEIAVQKT